MYLKIFRSNKVKKATLNITININKIKFKIKKIIIYYTYIYNLIKF